MCAPLLAEHGVIDKFIGDAIMAFFGAPIATADHGLAAVRAALSALETSDAIAAQLAARGLPPIRTRIGIHSGPAVVGNMGSSERFDYTAIGDTVNLASRLEGANKALGTRCLVSETAWAGAGAEVLGREVGRIGVVGPRGADPRLGAAGAARAGDGGGARLGARLGGGRGRARPRRPRRRPRGAAGRRGAPAGRPPDRAVPREAVRARVRRNVAAGREVSPRNRARRRYPPAP